MFGLIRLHKESAINESELSNVLSNAILPDMLYGGGVRLSCCAPLNDLI